MTIRNLFYLTILITLMSIPAMAESLVIKADNSLVDANALNLGDKKFGEARYGNAINGCSFQQDAIISHKDYQYIGYYDGYRQVCIARRKLPGGPWETIRFNDYQFKSNDAHNTISIGICPNDGTIHMAFDHHGDLLHYRISQKGIANNPETT